MREEGVSFIAKPSPAFSKVKPIIRAVAEYYGVTMGEIGNERRNMEIVRPRQVAVYLTNALTHLSLPRIGRAFGGRDQTTMSHSINRIEELRKTDAQLDADIRALLILLAPHSDAEGQDNAQC